jgi:hypothetical protein
MKAARVKRLSGLHYHIVKDEFVSEPMGRGKVAYKASSVTPPFQVIECKSKISGEFCEATIEGKVKP